MTTDSNELLAVKRWLELKNIESEAKKERQKIEDWLCSCADIKETTEGTVNYIVGNNTVKFIQRMTRKIDTDLLKQCAIESGAENHLKTLFRWKPEINLKAWKDTDSKITSIFLPAITTVPGRPSLRVITQTEKE